jgi:Amidohydrolase family
MTTTSAVAKPAGAAPARPPAQPLRLDRLIRARAVHSMTGEMYRSVGLLGAEITAVSADPDGLDDLAGTGTVVTDAGDLTLLPAFADSHEHLMEASRNTLLVPVDRARSVAEFTAMVAAAARDAAPGAWIMTAMAWHESNLAENRMPTGAELDAAAPNNPVLARRGGHLAVANTAALTAAGIGPGTPDPPGGKIGRRPDGHPDGVLEGGAVWLVAAFTPTPSRARMAEALGRGSDAYAALGVGTIREAMINTEELLAYQDAAERDTLSVRVRPLIRVGNELTADQATALIDGLGVRSGFGDDWLRIWGLKFVMDGGVEGGALEQPYTNDPAQSGHLNWDPAVRRGWRIGTHAAGDRAVRRSWTRTRRWPPTSARCRRGRWSSSTPCCPTRRSGNAPCAAASASPSSTRCCGTWAARCSRHGAPSAPATTSMKGVQDRKRAMVDGLRQVHLARYRASGAELIMGQARFTAPTTVEVDLVGGGGSRRISGDRVFLNLGTRATLGVPQDAHRRGQRRDPGLHRVRGRGQRVHGRRPGRHRRPDAVPRAARRDLHPPDAAEGLSVLLAGAPVSPSR